MVHVKILGISGSPRKDGNSRFLLEIALEAARVTSPDMVETEIYSISGKRFEPCDGCYQCETLGHCRITDDDFPELRDKWFAADVIIYSVPVYHMGIPSSLKSFIDRLGNSVQESFNDRPLKVIGVLTQGSGMSTGQEAVMVYLNSHAVMMGCIPVGGLWPIGYLGVGSWTHGRADKSTLRDLYAENDEDTVLAVEATKVLSKQIVLVSNILKSGGEQNRDMLKKIGGFEFFLRGLDNN